MSFSPPFSPYLSIRGARTHNLRNLSLDLPHDALTVIVGVSGSGKTSLAYDTLYAEAERRYLEMLSPAARERLAQLPRPDVDWIDGLRPALALSQRHLSPHPRATVGTLSELHDLLALLYVRLGTPHCPNHPTVPLHPQSLTDLTAALLRDLTGLRVALLVPAAALPPSLTTAESLKSAGYTRLHRANAFLDLDALFGPIPPDSALVIDRLRLSDDTLDRLTDSLEHAFAVGNGQALLYPLDPGPPPLSLSTRAQCPHCGFTLPKLEPRHLSFHHPDGACPSCRGLGVAPNGDPCADCSGSRLSPLARLLSFAGKTLPHLESLPLADLAPHLNEWHTRYATHPIAAPLLTLAIDRVAALIELGLDYLPLTRAASTLSSGERQRIRLAAILAQTMSGLLLILDEPTAALHPQDSARVRAALQRLVARGNTLIAVTHDRALLAAADHLVEIGPGAGPDGGALLFSGPPAQLTTLDTPTARHLTTPFDLTHRRQPTPADAPALWHIGAHRHNLQGDPICYPLARLIALTGPSGAGKSSALLALADALRSLIPPGGTDPLPPPPDCGQILLASCGTPFPLSPSSLPSASPLASPHPTAIPSASPPSPPLPWHRVVFVDATPIAATPRVTPATYLGILDHFRELFAQTPEARARGYGPERFSYNLRGGRCEVCEGRGWREISLSFLPPVSEPCPACRGARYNRETLAIRYRGKTIADLLATSVAQVRPLFTHHPSLAPLFSTLEALGLGHLLLGQPIPSLSGGETQRLKLARELARSRPRPTLFLLDEPSRGLHFTDLARLLETLLALRDRGHTIVIADHDPDLLRHVDWQIELGPGGGQRGGRVIAMGSKPIDPLTVNR
ncbi:MAG: AAA family ATPase [Hydrogenophilus sp.]|nr:AAA family ATPase [Hydrogenophilus sp.]